MATDQDPVIQRRRLRVWLRGARLGRGLTQKEVAKALDWSRSKLLRIEQGAVHLTKTDLEALLRFYGVEDERQVEELLQMAQVAKTQPWSAHRAVLRPDFIAYLGQECVAATIRSFAPLILPGLLQTEEYARATTLATSTPGDANHETVERRVRARMERQQLLDREDPPEMSFIIEEGVLHRHVGGAEAMIRQLEHLRQLARRPHINVQILPFPAGAHPGMVGAFVLLEFPDPADDDVLYLEDARGLVPREEEKDTARYKEIFFALEDMATVPLEQVIDDITVQIRRTAH